MRAMSTRPLVMTVFVGVGLVAVRIACFEVGNVFFETTGAQAIGFGSLAVVTPAMVSSTVVGVGVTMATMGVVGVVGLADEEIFKVFVAQQAARYELGDFIFAELPSHEAPDDIGNCADVVGSGDLLHFVHEGMEVGFASQKLLEGLGGREVACDEMGHILGQLSTNEGPDNTGDGLDVVRCRNLLDLVEERAEVRLATDEVLQMGGKALDVLLGQFSSVFAPEEDACNTCSSPDVLGGRNLLDILHD